MNKHHIHAFLMVSAAFLAVDAPACPGRHAWQPGAAARACSRTAPEAAGRKGVR